jgi:hypothetical protein
MIPHCLDNRLTDSGKVVSPKHRPGSTPQKIYFIYSGTHFCSRLSKHLGLVRLEGLDKFKKIHVSHGDSNPRPSGLHHNVLTTTLPRTPPYPP